MSSTWSQGDASTLGGNASREFDDAEKGLYESMQRLPVLPPTAVVHDKRVVPFNLLTPISPVHEGTTPSASNPLIPLKPEPASPRSPPAEKPEDKPVQKKPPPPTRKVSRWIRFQLWFNTYRKFFTFVTLFNLTGIIMAALNRFPYAEKHLGALVLGNLLCAILMRNELFLRFLYLIAIHGLRGVRTPLSSIV